MSRIAQDRTPKWGCGELSGFRYGSEEMKKRIRCAMSVLMVVVIGGACIGDPTLPEVLLSVGSAEHSVVSGDGMNGMSCFFVRYTADGVEHQVIDYSGFVYHEPEKELYPGAQVVDFEWPQSNTVLDDQIRWSCEWNHNVMLAYRSSSPRIRLDFYESRPALIYDKNVVVPAGGVEDPTRANVVLSLWENTIFGPLTHVEAHVTLEWRTRPDACRYVIRGVEGDGTDDPGAFAEPNEVDSGTNTVAGRSCPVINW